MARPKPKRRKLKEAMGFAANIFLDAVVDDAGLLVALLAL
jgi:hypothetical protein